MRKGRVIPGLALLLLCSAGTGLAGDGVRQEIEKARAAIQERLSRKREAWVEVQALASQLAPLTARLAEAEREKRAFLEKLFALDPEDEKKAGKLKEQIRRLEFTVSELKEAIGGNAQDNRQANLAALERQLEGIRREYQELLRAREGDLEARRREYEALVARYLQAAHEADGVAAPLDLARRKFDRRVSEWNEARQDYARLLAEAPERLAGETPPYLVSIEARTASGVFYRARWVDAKEAADRRGKVIEEQIRKVQDKVRRFETEKDEAMEEFAEATGALNRATVEARGSLWDLMWYDAAVDGSSTAVDIALNAKEMGIWAIPHQAVQESVGLIFREKDTDRGMEAFYDSGPSPADGILAAAAEILTNVAQGEIRDAVTTGVETLAKSATRDADLHAAVESVLFAPGKGIRDYLRMPAFKDVGYDVLKQAARESLGSKKWWKGKGKDIFLGVLKDQAISHLREDPEAFMARQPAVIGMLAAKGRHRHAYAIWKLTAMRRDAAQATLAALQDLHLKVLAADGRRRKMEKEVDVVSGDPPVEIALTFSSRVVPEGVRVILGGTQITEGGIVEGETWKCTWPARPPGKALLQVSAVEETSGKPLDADPSTVAVLVPRPQGIGFEGWEDGWDATHSLTFVSAQAGAVHFAPYTVLTEKDALGDKVITRMEIGDRLKNSALYEVREDWETGQRLPGKWKGNPAEVKSFIFFSALQRDLKYKDRQEAGANPLHYDGAQYREHFRTVQCSYSLIWEKEGAPGLHMNLTLESWPHEAGTLRKAIQHEIDHGGAMKPSSLGGNGFDIGAERVEGRELTYHGVKGNRSVLVVTSGRYDDVAPMVGRFLAILSGRMEGAAVGGPVDLYPRKDAQARRGTGLPPSSPPTSPPAPLADHGGQPPQPDDLISARLLKEDQFDLLPSKIQTRILFAVAQANPKRLEGVPDWLRKRSVTPFVPELADADSLKAALRLKENQFDRFSPEIRERILLEVKRADPKELEGIPDWLRKRAGR